MIRFQELKNEIGQISREIKKTESSRRKYELIRRLNKLKKEYETGMRYYKEAQQKREEQKNTK